MLFNETILWVESNWIRYDGPLKISFSMLALMCENRHRNNIPDPTGHHGHTWSQNIATGNARMNFNFSSTFPSCCLGGHLGN